MPRIRTIKPEFWSNEALSTCHETTRLLAIALINLADDDGWFKAHPNYIKSFAFPYVDPSIKVSDMLLDLIRIKYIRIFEDSDGIKYGFILNFANHQVINKKKDSKIMKMLIATGRLPDNYGSATVTLPTGMEQGTGKGKEKKKIKKKKSDEFLDDPWRSDFDEFWQLYPRKEGKEYCLKIYRKIFASGYQEKLLEKDRITPQGIVEAVKRQLPKLTSAGKFCKMPSTWLNGGCWADEVKETEIHPF